MVNMYEDMRKGVSESVIIDGHDFYAENITPSDAYNRREYNFTSIIGGTERVTPGKYIHREWSFVTTIYFPTGHPETWDKVFRKMMRGPVTVVSKYMGGTFKAIIQIAPSFPEYSPNHMDLDVTVTEVPDVKSNIVGETPLKVPSVKKIKVSEKKSSKSKTKNKSKTKTKKSKTKSVKKKNKHK